MSTPQAKRRRLDEAAKTLHKPFKSPFRTPLKPTFSDPPSSDPPELSNAVSATPVASHTNATTPAPSRTTAITPSSSRLLSASSRRPNFLTPSRPAQKNARISPSLTREIIQLRSDIQILEQALTLSTSTKDDDLVHLIDTWRTASRAAAEELFASTRDKVNMMGGVGAWKDREKEQREWRTKWDREEMEAERERRKEQQEEAGEQGRDYEDIEDPVHMGGEGEQKQEESGGNDSFTMDMMLKTLNVDLELIGYNKEAQRWDG